MHVDGVPPAGARCSCSALAGAEGGGLRRGRQVRRVHQARRSIGIHVIVSQLLISKRTLPVAWLPPRPRQIQGNGELWLCGIARRGASLWNTLMTNRMDMISVMRRTPRTTLGSHPCIVYESTSRTDVSLRWRAGTPASCSRRASWRSPHTNTRRREVAWPSVGRRLESLARRDESRRHPGPVCGTTPKPFLASCLRTPD